MDSFKFNINLIWILFLNLRKIKEILLINFNLKFKNEIQLFIVYNHLLLII